jgi:hypothetical protein
MDIIVSSSTLVSVAGFYDVSRAFASLLPARAREIRVPRAHAARPASLTGQALGAGVAQFFVQRGITIEPLQLEPFERFGVREITTSRR